MKRLAVLVVLILAVTVVPAGAKTSKPKLDSNGRAGCEELAMYYIIEAPIGDTSGLANVSSDFQDSKTKGVKALGQKLENAATPIAQQIALTNATRFCVKAGIVTQADLTPPS